MDAGTPTPPPGSSEDGITELGYTLKGLARVLGRAPRTLENAKRGNELRLRGESRPIRLLQVAGRWICPYDEWRGWIGEKLEAKGFANPYAEAGKSEAARPSQSDRLSDDRASRDREPRRCGRPRRSTGGA